MACGYFSHLYSLQYIHIEYIHTPRVYTYMHIEYIHTHRIYTYTSSIYIHAHLVYSYTSNIYIHIEYTYTLICIHRYLLSIVKELLMYIVSFKANIVSFSHIYIAEHSHKICSLNITGWVNETFTHSHTLLSCSFMYPPTIQLSSLSLPLSFIPLSFILLLSLPPSLPP